MGERKGEVDVCGVSWSRSNVAQDFTELFGGGHDGNDGTIVGRERVGGGDCRLGLRDSARTLRVETYGETTK